MDITREFAEHRTWYKNVSCTWVNADLLLRADSDHDPDGRGLMDEFSDCISAYIVEGFDGDLTLESVTKRDA